MSAYQSLHEAFARASALREAQALLNWDMQTTMPPGAAESRGVQLAVLETAAHEIVSAPKIADLLGQASEDNNLSTWQRANVVEMRREHAHAAGVEPALVDELARAGARCTNLWRVARPNNDFAAFRPELERVLALVREVAAQKGAALGLAPYDALIDQFEPGMTCDRVRAIFTPLRAALPAILDAALDKQAGMTPALRLDGPFDPELQKKLGERVMAALGFDFERGRLDRSAHPFCGGATDDIRITTRYRNDEFVSSLMGIIHETGHALYEQHLPADWARQPVGRARGMAIHESQSLLYEMQVGRSPEFLEFLAPLIRDVFGVSGVQWEPENLGRHVRNVRRGLIRVDADEVTYPTHVMLRFELEQELLAGTTTVADLPERWRALMLEFVGIAPDDDRDGCMQDVHWTDGAFGYFPSYTLGAMSAAQLFAAAAEQMPGLRQQISRGEMRDLGAWLGTHVHCRASVVSGDSLLEAATGNPLQAHAFLNHLNRRYVA